MKVIIYALAAVLAVPSTLGQHHTRRLGVVNEQAAMSIDMITEALSMQSTAAVEPNEDPVYPVFGGKVSSCIHHMLMNDMVCNILTPHSSSLLLNMHVVMI